MEQDINKNIRILEESIIQGKYHLYKKDLKKYVSNVIKAYKELEEKNKKKSIEIICYQEELENRIPVSLVEETIEEYQNNMKLYENETHNIFNENNIRQEVITVLQELLEKRK